MRKFNITVNGTPYQVEVEEVQAFASQPKAPVIMQVPAAVPAPQPVETPAAAPAAAPVAVPADGVKLTAPMPGTVVKIIAQTGKTVAKGETVVILESMKMENDIVASAAGVVTIAVTAGTNVNAGDVLAVIA